MDEKLGVRMAREQGLAVTGTLGVLLQAATRGLVDMERALTDLQATDFRCSHRVRNGRQKRRSALTSKPARGSAVSAAIVERHDLNIQAIQTSVRVHVLDARISEVNMTWHESSPRSHPPQHAVNCARATARCLAEAPEPMKRARRDSLRTHALRATARQARVRVSPGVRACRVSPVLESKDVRSQNGRLRSARPARVTSAGRRPESPGGCRRRAKRPRPAAGRASPPASRWWPCGTGRWWRPTGRSARWRGP